MLLLSGFQLVCMHSNRNYYSVKCHLILHLRMFLVKVGLFDLVYRLESEMLTTIHRCRPWKVRRVDEGGLTYQ